MKPRRVEVGQPGERKLEGRKILWSFTVVFVT